MCVIFFDNVNAAARDDMLKTIIKDSKVSVAAACFSMYAYEELKRQEKLKKEFEKTIQGSRLFKEERL